MKRLLTGIVVVLALLGSYAKAQPNFPEGSTPVNLGAIINSSAEDASPAVSKTGLSLYFHSARAGGAGLTDIWVS
jgi:WD40-like Beta Propeller Repeat